MLNVEQNGREKYKWAQRENLAMEQKIDEHRWL